jgi:hypothetical protein
MPPTRTSPIAALTMLLALALALPIGCATDSALNSGDAPEPRFIVIRNATGRDLAAVSIQEAGKPLKDAVRMGSISPLLRGRATIIERQTAAEPLPDAALVNWTDPQRGMSQAEVSLREPLRRATGAADEALVFDIQSPGRVRVTVEVVKP